MEPRIVEKDRIILIGFSFFGDPFAESGGWTEENEIGRLWNRLIAYLTAQGDRIRQIEDESVAYEVHIEVEETASKGYREVFVGLEVGGRHDVPVAVLLKIRPPATYAVVPPRGEEITSDWSRMITDWMDEADYRSAHPYTFQRYDRRFQGLDHLGASELDVYFPIEPA